MSVRAVKHTGRLWESVCAGLCVQREMSVPELAKGRIVICDVAIWRSREWSGRSEHIGADGCLFIMLCDGRI